MDYASVIKKGEKENESDYIRVFEDGDVSCFVLSDGRDNPDAAKIAVDTVVDDFKKSGAITKNSMSEFFAHADKLLKENDALSRACIATLMTDGAVAAWSNIGDCRVYLIRENLLYEITPDHSEAYILYEAGDIRYPKIRRQKIRHNLTRMLGDGYEAGEDASQPEMLRKGDSFLICSDGFWENIHERQIEKTLKRSKTAREWLDRMIRIIDKNIKHHKYTRFRDTLSAITIKM